MAKNISMTRERKIALPVILEMARAYLLTNADDGVLEPRDKARYERALEAFGDNPTS